MDENHALPGRQVRNCLAGRLRDISSAEVSADSTFYTITNYITELVAGYFCDVHAAIHVSRPALGEILAPLAFWPTCGVQHTTHPGEWGKETGVVGGPQARVPPLADRVEDPADNSPGGGGERL